MKTSAKVTVQNEIIKIHFDIFEAVWGYLMFDNISLMADSKNNSLRLFSFASGKEQSTADISKENMEALSKCNFFELNFSLGNQDTAVYKKEPIDVTGKFIEAIEAQFKRKNSTAIECYKAVVEANSNNFRALNLLGRCLRAEGKMDDAYECYKKAIEIAPESPEAYCNLGILFQKEGDEEKAQAAFYKAIEVDNFYCNALVKRASWLLEHNPDSPELKLYNLRISAVHQDVTSAQNHIKAYMEKMGYDRIEYSDKETALFGDYADYKLQKKLKNIEAFVNNGAFGSALNTIKEAIESTKGTSAENLVSGWCHTRAKRSSQRLGETINKDVFDGLQELIKSTPATNEDDLIVFVKEAELKLDEERNKEEKTEKTIQHLSNKDGVGEPTPTDRESAEAASKEAIAKIENKITEDGDYAQPIGVPIEKEATEEEKDEALAEQSLLNDINDVPRPAPIEEPIKPQKVDMSTASPVPSPVTEKPLPTEEKDVDESKDNEDLMANINDMPAPKPVSSNIDLMTGVDDIPAPKPVMSNVDLMTGVDDIPAPKPVMSNVDLMTGVDDIPAPKPVMSNVDLMTGVDDIPAPKPVSSNVDLMTGIENTPAPKPIMSNVDLMTGVDDIPAPKPVSSNIDLMTGVDNTPAPKPNLSPKSTAELMAEINVSEAPAEAEPRLKPMSTAELMAEAKISEAPAEAEPMLKPMSTAELMAKAKNSTDPAEAEPMLKPMSTAELMAEAKNYKLPSESETTLMPKSTAELMAEAKNVNLPPEPILSAKTDESKPQNTSTAQKATPQDKKVDTKNVALDANYKSPVKDVKPVTVQEFFMLVLYEVMRDGDIEDPEKRFLTNLKNFLKISDNDYDKMFNHISKQIAISGKLDKGAEGKFNPKRVFKNLCKAALRDGILEDSEKKLLIAASKLFKINEQDVKKILIEAKNK